MIVINLDYSRSARNQRSTRWQLVSKSYGCLFDNKITSSRVNSAPTYRVTYWVNSTPHQGQLGHNLSNPIPRHLGTIRSQLQPVISGSTRQPIQRSTRRQRSVSVRHYSCALIFIYFCVIASLNPYRNLILDTNVTFELECVQFLIDDKKRISPYNIYIFIKSFRSLSISLHNQYLSDH